MSAKRTRDAEDAVETNASAAQLKTKRRKGFTVGPENLPDGTYRRKVQKIKRDLIQKAKVKKAYAKIKTAEGESTSIRSSYYNYEEPNENDEKVDPVSSASLELHPDRQAMLDVSETQAAANEDPNRQEEYNERGRRKRRPKPSAFRKEIDLAEKRRKEQEARQRERELKAKERESMTRARRPDQYGRRRLGRESRVLLSKIQRTMGVQ